MNKTIKTMSKKTLSAFLAIIMVFTAIPIYAFANDGEEGNQPSPSYVVEYNSNYPDGAVAGEVALTQQQSQIYPEQPTTLTLSDWPTDWPTPDNYTLVGWSTSPSGLSVNYAFDATVGSDITGTLKLYASWSPNAPPVVGGGNNSPAPQNEGGLNTNEVTEYDVTFVVKPGVSNTVKTVDGMIANPGIPDPST